MLRESERCSSRVCVAPRDPVRVRIGELLVQYALRCTSLLHDGRRNCWQRLRGGSHGHKRRELRAARHVGTVHLVRDRLLTLGLAVGGLPADAVRVRVRVGVGVGVRIGLGY